MSGTDTTAGTVVESHVWPGGGGGGVQQTAESFCMEQGTEAQVHLWRRITHRSVWQSKDVYPHQPGQNRRSSCSFRPHWDSALWHHPFLVFPVCTVKPLHAGYRVKSALFVNSAEPVQTHWDWNYVTLRVKDTNSMTLYNYICNKLANYTKTLSPA